MERLDPVSVRTAELFNPRSNPQILLQSDHRRGVGISGICLVAKPEQEEGRVAASAPCVETHAGLAGCPADFLYIDSNPENDGFAPYKDPEGFLRLRVGLHAGTRCSPAPVAQLNQTPVHQSGTFKPHQQTANVFLHWSMRSGREAGDQRRPPGAVYLLRYGSVDLPDLLTHI